MTEDWIKTTLAPLLDATKRNVVLEDVGHGIVSIGVSDMAAMFASIAAPATHASLSATPQAAAGWQAYFDAWQKAGYIQ